jgi:poly(A) polymerase
MEIRLEQIDPDALRVVQRLLRYQHKAYLVGGCVRDLLLGRKPKDFDVATSATPNDIRRTFRNCRIIGRRFRLAHVFFGRKIIETATFRANPRAEEDPGESPTDENTTNGTSAAVAEGNGGANGNGTSSTASNGASSSNDLLIRHDNVFGTAEEDARRRDFTINGLFFDVQSVQVIDHVGGLPDLEARLVRTIGDPDVRFREDPVRILRAVKFSARCDLTIEPETFRFMMEHKAELAKCAQARVTEEFYRLLRAGAARRSFELLMETGLLEFLLPELAQAWRKEEEDPEVKHRIQLFWSYMRALDEAVIAREQTPSDAMILATLLLPPLRKALAPDAAPAQNMVKIVADSVQPFFDRLKVSRRDADLCRQILLALRFLLPGSRARRQRASLAHRPFFQEALWLANIVARAEGAEPVVLDEAAPAETTPDAAGTEEEVPPELLVDPEDGGRRRDRHRGRGPRPEPTPSSQPAVSTPDTRREAAPIWQAGPRVRTPIPNLDDLGPLPLPRPAFLGRGSFGSRWAGIAD